MATSTRKYNSRQSSLGTKGVHTFHNGKQIHIERSEDRFTIWTDDAEIRIDPFSDTIRIDIFRLAGDDANFCVFDVRGEDE